MQQESVFRMNQEGYAPGMPVHIAVLTTNPVTLKDAAGNTVRTLAAEEPEQDPASGDRVRIADLGLLDEGEYTLECKEESRSLIVSDGAWTKVTNALIKGLYYQRCGCELSPAFAGPYTHPACHTAPAADWEDRTVFRRVPGGWHDAGDYGKYTGPGAVAAAHLMYAWKLFPRGCSDPLNIPETGNGIPDILNETKYELDWLLGMQRSDGAFHHKLTKEKFAPFIMPQDDTEPEYLMPVSHCATAAACACLALAYRVFREYNEAFSNRMMLSACRAWDWLQAHPDFVPYQNPEGVRTGWYGDRSDSDERFWAACELYAATGDVQYREAAEALYAEGQRLTQFGWADVGGMGALCCLFDLKERKGGRDPVHTPAGGFPAAERRSAPPVPGIRIRYVPGSRPVWLGQYSADSEPCDGYDHEYAAYRPGGHARRRTAPVALFPGHEHPGQMLCDRLRHKTCPAPAPPAF